MNNDFEFNFVFYNEEISLEALLSAYISNILNSDIKSKA